MLACVDPWRGRCGEVPELAETVAVKQVVLVPAGAGVINHPPVKPGVQGGGMGIQSHSFI